LMPATPFPIDRTRSEHLAALRAELESARAQRGPALPFGIAMLDDRLADGGLDGAGLHEIAAASASLNDDAAATLFAAGIAARFAARSGTVLWALSKFDLYAPGIEQAGLGPAKILYAQGRKDADVLALAEDAGRFGLERIADLYPMPRGPLAKRLGLAAVDRLDQARGALAEPIVPVISFEAPEAERRLPERACPRAKAWRSARRAAKRSPRPGAWRCQARAPVSAASRSATVEPPSPATIGAVARTASFGEVLGIDAMTNRHRLALAAAVVACAWAAPALADPCEGPLPVRGARFAGVVRYVGDGDGLCVGPANRPGNWIEVRLADFYAPELHEPGGAQAKRRLIALVMGRTIICRAGRRSYDRVIGSCELAGRPLGYLLRARGGTEGGRGKRHGR